MNRLYPTVNHDKLLTMKKKVFIGLTYGDPAGIGPEILTKVLTKWKHNSIPYIIGAKDYFKKIGIPDSKKRKFYFHSIDGLNFGFKPGQPSSISGKHAYECLKLSIELAIKKRISSLITGPVSKEMINKANIKFSGQTEALAKICKVNPDKTIMLFNAKDLRLALYTRHIPLKDVSSKITQKKLIDFLTVLNNELKKWFEIKNPHIAILGLNPHASENSLFGNEEQKIIIPVVKKLNKSGFNITGPLSPDATLAKAGQDFLSGKKQKFDCFVSFYHDQGLPMFKAVAGLNGLNVTLGLPFLRISVDHGTAFDIAGKNKALPDGLQSAIQFAEDIALNRKK